MSRWRLRLSSLADRGFEGAQRYVLWSISLLARLSLLVLMFTLIKFPKPADSGFAATRELVSNAPATLWQVPLDIAQRVKGNAT